MAFTPSPPDTLSSTEAHPPPKSYADADADTPTDNANSDNLSESSTAIDEEAIKETPPRPQHARTTSEPRPFGEVMDEAERDEASSPSQREMSRSPTLRHPKGRLEETESWEKAEVVGMDGSGLTNGVDGDGTPDAFDGVGEDEAVRSPTRRPHRKTSSKGMNGNVTPKEQTVAEEGSEILFSNSLKPADTLTDTNPDQSALPYENLTNKSGENLASLKPSSGYYLSLSQNANKPTAPHTRQNSSLVSGRRAGLGWSRSAIRWAPFNIPLQRRLQTLLVLLHTLSIAGLLSLYFSLCTIPLLWPVLLPYTIYVLLSRAPVSGKLSQRSNYLRSWKIWSLFASYFPARLHRSQSLEPTRKYIFGYHPHGIISHGAFAAFATEACGFSQLFPGITNTLLTLDSNFRIPFYRDYALRMGLASVSRESCENLLSHGGPNGEGMGRAITIVVGGARESLDAKPFSLRLVLKKRKGFVKLAVRTGADLVPVLAFGENDLYDQLDMNAHPYVHRLQLLVKRVMGFTVCVLHPPKSLLPKSYPYPTPFLTNFSRFPSSTPAASSTTTSA